LAIKGENEMSVKNGLHITKNSVYQTLYNKTSEEYVVCKNKEEEYRGKDVWLKGHAVEYDESAAVLAGKAGHARNHAGTTTSIDTLHFGKANSSGIEKFVPISNSSDLHTGLSALAQKINPKMNDKSFYTTLVNGFLNNPTESSSFLETAEGLEQCPDYKVFEKEHYEHLANIVATADTMPPIVVEKDGKSTETTVFDALKSHPIFRNYLFDAATDHKGYVQKMQNLVKPDSEDFK